MAHHLFAELLFLRVVGVFRRREQPRLQFLPRQATQLVGRDAAGLGNDRRERLQQRQRVPLLLALRRRVGHHQALDLLGDPVLDHLAQVLLAEDAAAVGVDHLALLVQHVVVLDDVLADVEVVGLDLRLGVLDRLRHPGVLQGHVFFHPEAVHQLRDVAAPEPAHQLVLE